MVNSPFSSVVVPPKGLLLFCTYIKIFTKGIVACFAFITLPLSPSPKDVNDIVPKRINRRYLIYIDALNY